MTKNITVTAGSRTTVTLDMPSDMNDYKCIGLSDMGFSGTNAEYIVPRGWGISNGSRHVTLPITSLASSSITCQAYAYGIFIPK